jgi:hypothetical protein
MRDRSLGRSRFAGLPRFSVLGYWGSPESRDGVYGGAAPECRLPPKDRLAAANALAMTPLRPYAVGLGAKRAKRRRRERKREKRELNPRPRRSTVVAGSLTAPAEGPRSRPTPDSAGDEIAREHEGPEEPEGGAAVREPRRPKPRGPAPAGIALEAPHATEPADGVAAEQQGGRVGDGPE